MQTSPVSALPADCRLSEHQARARKRRPLWTDSRHLGLALALLCGKYLLKTGHLHYGYWSQDLPVTLANLPAAQQRLADLILANIPADVRSILDVGSGAGALAAQILSRGCSVDCVCPNPVLVRHARRQLRRPCRVFQCRFEELETHRRYDLVLFSESFQYTRMHKSLEQVLRYTRPGGYLLICDFFKTDAPGRCLIGGGQSLSSFNELVGRSPFSKLHELDITPQTAPTIDVLNRLLAPLAPSWRFIHRLLRAPASLLALRSAQSFPGKLNLVEQKYFSGLRTGQHFSTFKSYRLLLYQRQPSGPKTKQSEVI